MRKFLFLTYIFILFCTSLLSCSDSDFYSDNPPKITIDPPTYALSWAASLPKLSSITCYEKTEELNIDYITFERFHTFTYKSNLLEQYIWEESYSIADIYQINQQTHTLSYLPLTSSLPQGEISVIIRKADSSEQLVYVVNSKGQALTCNYFTGNETNASTPSRTFNFAYNESGYMTRLTQETILPSGNLEETILTFNYTDDLLREINSYISDKKSINSKTCTLVNTFTFGYDDDSNEMPNSLQLPPALYLFELYPLNLHTEALMAHLLGKQSAKMCNNMQLKDNDKGKRYYHYQTDPTNGHLNKIVQSGEIERTVNIEIR